MDANKFSFNALFECPEFDFYENKEFKKSYSELCRILEVDMGETALRKRLDEVTIRCIQEARMDAFKQGFAFAVKSIKFLLKI